MIDPFLYPTSDDSRRHFPKGYSDYSNYKPWLRDEFEFRCVYCLSRERWFPDGDDSFGADHLKCRSAYPDLTGDYNNLVYTCIRCNSAKQDLELPVEGSFGDHLCVSENGEVEALTSPGDGLIKICGLNRPKLVEFRRGIIEICETLSQYSGDSADRMLKKYFGYPSNLPDLSKLRPPGGNERPEGIESSFFEREKRKSLPFHY